MRREETLQRKYERDKPRPGEVEIFSPEVKLTAAVNVRGYGQQFFLRKEAIPMEGGNEERLWFRTSWLTDSEDHPRQGITRFLEPRDVAYEPAKKLYEAGAPAPAVAINRAESSQKMPGNSKTLGILAEVRQSLFGALRPTEASDA